MSEARPFDFDLSRAAFIIVDMQNDFVRKGAPLAVEDAIKTIEPIQNTLKLFRGHQRPVIYTRFIAGAKETLLWKWSPELYPPINCCRPGFHRFYEDIQAERHCIAVVEELKPQQSDYVLDKYWYGAFFRTCLYDILLSEHVDTVVIAGTVTQICVEETARQAFHLSLRTVVLKDCVSSFDPELHSAALKNFSMKFGRVLTSQQLTAEAQ